MAVTVKERAAVFARDGGRCAACGRATSLTIQHRINRQMGGSKFRDGFTFWLTLCWSCNDALERDAEMAAEGRLMGWKLQTTEDTAVIAVFFMWAWEWRLLDAEGGYDIVYGRGPHEVGVRS